MYLLSILQLLLLLLRVTYIMICTLYGRTLKLRKIKLVGSRGIRPILLPQRDDSSSSKTSLKCGAQNRKNKQTKKKHNTYVLSGIAQSWIITFWTRCFHYCSLTLCSLFLKPQNTIMCSQMIFPPHELLL